MICGNCGLDAHELTRPTVRHARAAYCPWCNTYKTYYMNKNMPSACGWFRNTSPPQWVRDVVKEN